MYKEKIKVICKSLKVYKIVKYIYNIIISFYKKLQYIFLYLNFINDFYKFKYMMKTSQLRFNLLWKNRYPCVYDKTYTTEFNRHYVYHTSWAARIIAQIKPEFHIDISSSLYFCGIVSAFIPVRFYDYRPADLKLSNLFSASADLLDLFFDNESVASLSCMHTVEHIGLGRYGDPLDPDGDLKAIEELKRVIKVGGNLLFVVPIGRPKLMFNGHRIYSYSQIISYFSGFNLHEFAFIPDNPSDGGLIINATENMANTQNDGCGCFWFVKSH